MFFHSDAHLKQIVTKNAFYEFFGILSQSPFAWDLVS